MNYGEVVTGPSTDARLLDAAVEFRVLADPLVDEQAAHRRNPAGLAAREWDLEQAMIEVLLRYLPGIPVLAEERWSKDQSLVGASGGTQRIVLDPLDGSNSYLRGSGLYSTTAALYGPRGPEAGFVYQPATKDLYFAARGRGASLNGEPLPGPVPAPSAVVSVRSTIRGSVEVERFVAAVGATGYRIEQQMSCSSLKLCWVATGRRGAVVKHVRRVAGELLAWGTAAGALIALEAGCSAVQLDGVPWTGGDGNLLVASPSMLEQLRRTGWPSSGPDIA